MAYIVSTTNAEATNTSPQTLTLPSCLSTDVLLVAVSQRVGGVNIATATAGWTAIGTQAASGNARMGWFWAFGTAANPNFTGDTQRWIFTTYVIRDAHATTPIGTSSGTDYVRSDWNAAWTANSGSLTTSVDNCLLIYGCVSDTDNQSVTNIRNSSDDVSIDQNYIHTVGSIRHWVGHLQAGPAGAAPTATFYFNDANSSVQQGGNIWIIAVRNKASGVLQPDCRSGVSKLCWYGDFGISDGVTLDKPRQFPDGGVTTSIGTISTSNTAITTLRANDLVNPPGQFTEIDNSENVVDAWAGVSHTISSTDMTGKVFGLQWGASSTALVGANGWCVGFSDGTNWVVYQLSTPVSTLPLNPTSNYSTIALGNATALFSGGSINWAAVTRVAYMWHRNGSAATTRSMYIKNATLQSAAKIVGGGLLHEAKPYYLPNLILNSGFVNLANLQGAGQTLGKANFQIGDGSTQTYCDLSASSFEYPLAYDASSSIYKFWNATAGAVSFTIKASANDTINATACVFATSTAQAFTIDAASSTSATYSFAGASFVGWNVTWKTGVTCSNVTFKNGGIIDFKGTTITNVIANGGTGTALISASTGFSATGCTFTASSTAVYGIRIAAAGTFSLASTTFSGFTKDIDVTAVAGTVTINLAAGQATPTYQTAGATVSIVSSPVFQKVIVSGFTAGSRVQIYDTTSSAELFNGTASSGNTIVSGSTATWTDSAAAVASRAIRVRVAYVFGTSAKNFIDASGLTCGTASGSESVTYPVTPTDDSVYNANAIDGSSVTGITISVGPSRVSINLGGGTVSWPSIYAYQVYWQNTATGIAQETAFIEATDQANYLLTTFKLKNTSATPLTVTGGWGRDSTTLRVADIVDSATSTGNIYIEPDHVVAYAYATGLTAGQSADLSAAATSAAAAATSAAAAAASTSSLTYTGTSVKADIRYVNGTLVNGSGTAARPWGP